MGDRIDIALGFDAKYTPHGANVISSIARHAPGADLRFIVLHDGVSDDRRKLVEACAPKAAFHWVAVGDDDLPAHEVRGHLTRAIIFRLGLEKLAPADCRRVLYIDSDTVVLGDVRELWTADLRGNAIGAVPDCYISATEFAEKWQLPAEEANYFNSGVLVIDLAQVRAKKLFGAALDFFVAHDAQLLFSDQDALNFVFWRRWTGIEPTWNVQRYVTPKELAEEPRADRRWGKPGPRLVHYIGMEKPWMPNVWHPWAWLYWENMRRTPFAEEVQTTFKMDFYQLARLRLRWWLKRPPQMQAVLK